MNESDSYSAPEAIRPIPKNLSIQAHLREFIVRRDAWTVLFRNFVPVVGVFVFHWSAHLAIFSYWFDGIVGLSAIFTTLIPRAFTETDKAIQKRGFIKRTFLYIFVWFVLLLFICLPYWITLIPLQGILLSPKLWSDLARSPSLWATFGFMIVSQYYHAFKRGYPRLPEKELQQAVRWDAYLFILRGVAMFMLTIPGLEILLIPIMAIVLSYLEIWPERALSLWGDPSKLGEYEVGEDDTTGFQRGRKIKKRKLP